MLKALFFCFIPIFVAVDPLGTLPIFMGLTQGFSRAELRKVVLQSTATALLVAVLFLLGGTYLLKLLGLNVADFMVAGGILLFLMSTAELLAKESVTRNVETEEVGAVPIGVPLIAGPALPTTSLLLNTDYGFWPTFLAIVINIGLAGVVFFLSRPILQALGRTGARTMSKLSSLLLAAISVMIVRKGIMIYLSERSTIVPIWSIRLFISPRGRC